MSKIDDFDHIIEERGLLYTVAFIVVTYKRPDILQSLLSFVKEINLEDFGVGYYIMDGSPDDLTEKMVMSKFSSVVNYHHLPNTTIGERIIIGTKIASAKYICICGDSSKPNFDYFDVLHKAFSQNYDLINFTYRDVNDLREKEYTSISDMYRELAWDMTQMGDVFFKKESYRVFDIDCYRGRYNTEYFIQNAIYFDCYIGHNFKGFHMACPIITLYQGNNKTTWQETKFIEVACYGWADYVENEIDMYSGYNKEVLLSHGKYSYLGLDKVSTFIKLAIKNQLNREIFDEYEMSIERTCAIPLSIIKTISYSPLPKLHRLYSFFARINTIRMNSLE